MSTSENDKPLPPALHTSAQLVGKVARDAQKRHETAQREAQRARPDFILDIEQSRTAYTLPPPLLPLRYVNYEALARSMREKWDLTPDLSSIKLEPSLLQKISSEAGTAEDFEAAVMEEVLKGREGTVSFIGGRYRLSTSEFVPIDIVQLNFETVLVSVAGIGKVAEAVAQEIVELVSASAGASRSWSEIENQVRLAGYATTTRVNLGSDLAFDEFLSPRLHAFLDAQMVHGERFAAHTKSYHARDQLGPPPDAILTFALDDLVLFVANFDPRTGMARQGEIRFSITGRGDYRSGEVSVSSDFPYEVHEKFIGQLIESMEAKQSTS